MVMTGLECPMTFCRLARVPPTCSAGHMVAGRRAALGDDVLLERILGSAADAGATAASYTLIRLPWEIKELFEDWLALNFPDRKEKVLNQNSALPRRPTVQFGMGR